MGQERYWWGKILLDHVGNVKEFGFSLGITGSHFKLFNGKCFKLWNSRFDLLKNITLMSRFSYIPLPQNT